MSWLKDSSGEIKSLAEAQNARLDAYANAQNVRMDQVYAQTAHLYQMFVDLMKAQPPKTER